jgi:hypothetical protein
MWLSGRRVQTKAYKLRFTTKAYKLSYNYINCTINLVGRSRGKWRKLDLKQMLWGGGGSMGWIHLAQDK